MGSSTGSVTDDDSTLVGAGTDTDSGSECAEIVGDASMVDENVLKCKYSNTDTH